MDGQGEPARITGIVRVLGLVMLGISALAMLLRALGTGSVGTALLAAMLFASFAALARSSVRSATPLADGPGAALATHEHPYEPVEQPPGSATREVMPPVATPEATGPEAAEPTVDPDPAMPTVDPGHVGDPLTSSAPDSAPPEGPCGPAPLVQMPVTLDAEDVATALLRSAQAAGDVVAAHLWLEDAASGTLRQVASVGSYRPDEHPLSLDDDPLGLSIEHGTARMTALFAPATHSCPTTTLWRFAVPLDADGWRGVVGVDFRSAEAPDADVLVNVTAALRPAITGSLALHVAHTETSTARTLIESARQLSRRLDEQRVLDEALEAAMKISDAATGSIMLIDDASAEMTIAASRGLEECVVRDTRVREGEGIAGWVFATRKPLLIEDLPGRDGSMRRRDVRSAISVPVADEDGMLGVMSIASRTYPARFTDDHMQALDLLGTQTAAALRNARAVTSARDLYFATLRALTLALESRDPYSHGGTERVARLSVELGERFELTETELQALEIAALLHDIGMNTSGETFAASTRPLSTFERGLLKMHPVLAAEILEEVPALASVVPIVYHHHEWYDGSGYVVGLAGEAIPLAARILAVADAFVAMTSDRPHRPAMSEEAAVAELVDNSGTQFDPEVVRTFLETRKRRP